MSSPFLNFRDPTTADGRKLWELATKPLKSLFDGSRKNYPLFKSQLRNKIKTCHWQDITEFAVDGQLWNLVDNPDLIPEDNVVETKETRDYILVTGPRQADPNNNVEEITQGMVNDAHLAQLHSHMLHQVLTNSVTGDLEAHVASLENQEKTQDDGPILLKLIQDKVRGKAVRQNMRNTREKIRQLSLAEHKWNITNFNETLKALLLTLKNNEDTMPDKDITDMVIKNFKQVKHTQFQTMLALVLDTAELANEDPDWESLCEKAQNKFDTLVAEGIWGKRTPQEEQIFALQAQVKALQALQAESKKSDGPKKAQAKSEGSSGAQDSSTKKKKKRTYEDWQFKNPDNKKTVKKTVTLKGESKDVTYYWCKNHVGGKGMWVRHKPEDCKGKNKTAPSEGASSGGNPTLQARATVIRDEQE